MRHVQIDPIRTEINICHAIHDAPKQGLVPNEHFGRFQTLENIPSGRVAGRRHDLEEFVVVKTRYTHNQDVAKLNKHTGRDVFGDVCLIVRTCCLPYCNLDAQHSTYCGIFHYSC